MVVSVKNLVKRYGDLVALDHFNLQVEEGEIFGLLGPNGSGKTTAINCILSLLKYEKGSDRYFRKAHERRMLMIHKREISALSCRTSPYSRSSPCTRISTTFVDSMLTDKAEACKKLVEEAIRLCRPRRNSSKFYPKKLSGGLLQKTQYRLRHRAQAQADHSRRTDGCGRSAEPQQHILEGILRRSMRNGATVVYTSHYMEEVEQICSRIAIHR